MGAAGRDFHNFLVRYRDDEGTKVVAFTATQIPGIDERIFPPDFTGPLYPQGIPIEPESRLVDLIAEHGVSQVVFAYSDISHVEVMHRASHVLACGADFVLLGPDHTSIRADVPVVSVCAVRTGVGKSAITRAVHAALTGRGLTAVAIRHPMPYRNLANMAVERYATIADLEGITVEEREEYEHLVEHGITVFAGVDYKAIARVAAAESDVIIWDGGNNDLPFLASDLEIVALDPHRAGHERLYHPGETNFLRADVLVINKVDTAAPDDVDGLVAAAKTHNPDAQVVKTHSIITVEDDASLSGKRVLVIEDGPTVTHGGMAYGAGAIASRRLGAELVDPRPYAAGTLRNVFAENLHLTDILPAMGYSASQLAELEATIAATPCDAVVVGTPVDLTRIITIDQPTIRVTYSIADDGEPTLDEAIDTWCSRMGLS